MSLRCLDHLDRVVIDYNRSIHSSIGMDPKSVELKDLVDLHEQALVEYASMGGENIELINEGVVPSLKLVRLSER